MNYLNKPEISIIVPVYNVSNYLQKSINSISNQTFKNIEIICINDYSTDNSLSILEDFSKKDTRIKIINHTKNLGVSTARNSGLKVAKGEYIMFLDPDDYVNSDFCEKMLKAIKSNNYDLAICNVNIELDKNMLNNRGYTNDKNYASQNTVWCWNKIFKKKLITDNNITFPDGLLGEDAYFTNCYKLISNENFAIIEEKLYTYLIRKNSLMSVFDEKDNILVFNCFDIAELTYNFFLKQKNSKKISDEKFNTVYDYFFKSINIALKYFSEKYFNELSKKIYKLIKNKTEIKITKNGFEIFINNEKRFYEAKNKCVLEMINKK